jgi:predicted P-loop ATPase
VGIGNWKDQLLKSQSGTPKGCLQNALVALEHASEWQGVLGFDQSTLRVVATAAPPWDSRPALFTWSDEDDVRAAAWMQQQGIMISKDIIGQAVQTVARGFRFHPIHDYLNALVWDGISRIDDWLTLYLGVESSEFVRAVGMKFLVGAVARVFQPGCKNDTCLVLEGAQGALKSTALKVLAGTWFTDEIADLGSKDAALQLRGTWIVELPELDAFGRAETSRIKAFISRSTDRFRPPYGRHVIEVPRESVFAGTVNHETYLKDETGGRRFWPVRCGVIKIEGLRRDRDQLWAEAVKRLRAGEIWWIDSTTLTESAAEEQQERYDEDPWQSVIADWVQDREYVTSKQILRQCLEKQPSMWSQADKNRVARCLRAIGWTRKKGPADESRQREWRYYPGPSVRFASH